MLYFQMLVISNLKSQRLRKCILCRAAFNVNCFIENIVTVSSSREKITALYFETAHPIIYLHNYNNLCDMIIVLNYFAFSCIVRFTLKSQPANWQLTVFDADFYMRLVLSKCSGFGNASVCEKSPLFKQTSL